jgi:ABC-type Fe3+/spermidine/putrescine transport system ATPase subunit
VVRLRGGIKIKGPRALLDGPVILGVRREQVRISDRNPEPMNVLEGEIREVRFLGDSREYLIRLTNEDIITSRQFAEGPEPRFGVGEKIAVGFEERAVLMFEYPRQGLRKELEMA